MTTEQQEHLAKFGWCVTNSEEQERLAAIGRDYIRDRQRFTKFIETIRRSRSELPSLQFEGSIDEAFDGDVWQFSFAGVALNLEFVPQAASAMGKSAILIAQAEGVYAGSFGCATINADGRTENVAEGLTLLDDDLAVFHALLAKRFMPQVAS